MLIISARICLVLGPGPIPAVQYFPSEQMMLKSFQ